MADRLEAMIDRAVEDGSDELFDAVREICWQNDTASGEGSRQNRSLFEDSDLSDLHLMVALRSVRAIEATVCDAPNDEGLAPPQVFSILFLTFFVPLAVGFAVYVMAPNAKQL